MVAGFLKFNNSSWLQYFSFLVPANIREGDAGVKTCPSDPKPK